MPGKEGDHPAEVRRIQILKILLAACNAKYIHSNLAVYNLKSCSGKYSPNVVIKEYTINQIRDDDYQPYREDADAQFSAAGYTIKESSDDDDLSVGDAVDDSADDYGDDSYDE